MSWSGFKKVLNRAGTQVMLKTGQMEETIDREYALEEKKFKSMESTSTKLHKELRKYLDTLKILSTSQVNVAEVLSAFYGVGDELSAKDNKYGNLALEYYQLVKKLNDESLRDLEEPYRQTVLNPVARFNSYYVEINSAMKKRAHKKLDYDAMKNKVRKLMDKTYDGSQEEKLETYQAQLMELEKTYDEINDQLKEELPRFINLRIPFLDPSFESFVKIQLRYFNENYAQFNALQSKLDAQTREDFANGNLDKKIDNTLAKMRELTITSV